MTLQAEGAPRWLGIWAPEVCCSAEERLLFLLLLKGAKWRERLSETAGLSVCLVARAAFGGGLVCVLATALPVSDWHGGVRL